ncbi:DUF6332 family protein [Embleya sp. NPDC059237]|uniref:DUF6332 family protein n=1 Tax=Embleya sp. NPDC059237 TaxID=3346784 RepID=UPI0036B8FB6C
MDMGRESRWEKDAMTVEIVFAVVTAVVVAAIVFGAVLLPTLIAGVSGPARNVLTAMGAVTGGAAGLWRVVRVLVHFDARRHQGR